MHPASTPRPQWTACVRAAASQQPSAAARSTTKAGACGQVDIQAFDMLRKLSQDSNIRLVDIAQRVIDTSGEGGS
jgi:hypothetical protein